MTACIPRPWVFRGYECVFRGCGFGVRTPRARATSASTRREPSTRRAPSRSPLLLITSPQHSRVFMLGRISLSLSLSLPLFDCIPLPNAINTVLPIPHRAWVRGAYPPRARDEREYKEGAFGEAGTSASETLRALSDLLMGEGFEGVGTGFRVQGPGFRGKGSKVGVWTPNPEP